MRVTTKGRYALRAITNLAMASSGQPVPIKKIAKDEDISPEFLEQIFFKLKKSGIISSVRGPGGGFVLSRNPDEISAKAVFDAVGEGIELTPCTSYLDDGSGDCIRREDCIVHDVWQEASAHIQHYFENLTLQKIMDRGQGKLYETMVGGREFSV